ncbi:hypothetical protein JW906_09365 [bacterium]|nr:hypothetical protein [bacterium]
MIRWMTALSWLAVLAGCTGRRTVSGPDLSGSWYYTAWDTAGAAVAHGWFTLTQGDSGSFGGQWHFEKTGNDEKIGPQAGSDTLVGGVDEKGRVWMELRPGWRDNNIFLLGVMDREKYEGEWNYLSFTGPTNHGPFLAVK